jgi:hypothetical protein
VVKYGAAVEALSIKKQTPMHLAAQNGMKVLYIKTLNKNLTKNLNFDILRDDLLRNLSVSADVYIKSEIINFSLL